MLKNLNSKIKKNFEIFGLVFLVLITAISTSYFNYQKKISSDSYNNFIEIKNDQYGKPKIILHNKDI